MLHASVGVKHAVPSPLRWRAALVPIRHLLTLAIETSCDDTCVAILGKRDEKKNEAVPRDMRSQAKLHFSGKITLADTGKGGIHPLEALESHSANLSTLIQRSIHHLPDACQDTPASKCLVQNGGAVKKKPDFISATRGPGMRTNLRCGMDTAKGLATAWQIPLLGVHHMQAHALTPRLVHALGQSSAAPQPSFPFLTLLVSGGHTMLLHSTSLTSHKVLAETLDTAVGDCLDKAGRSILPPELLSTLTSIAYAKHLSNYAFPDPSTYESIAIPATRVAETQPTPHPYNWTLPHPLSHTRQLSFSFAGIPSAITKILTSHPNMPDTERQHLARLTLSHTFTHLTSRLTMALESLTTSTSTPPISTLVVSGGVAANAYLRYFLRAVLDARGYKSIQLIFPPVELCTDNAAMIAWAGMEMFEAGWRTSLACDVKRKWGMDETGEDGGILGSGGWYREGGNALGEESADVDARGSGNGREIEEDRKAGLKARL